jgi:hypothetical protein
MKVLRFDENIDWAENNSENEDNSHYNKLLSNPVFHVDEMKDILYSVYDKVRIKITLRFDCSETISFNR